MPEIADLPEYMPEAEFKRRFGGVGAPAYTADDAGHRTARRRVFVVSLSCARPIDPPAPFE